MTKKDGSPDRRFRMNKKPIKINVRSSEIPSMEKRRKERSLQRERKSLSKYPTSSLRRELFIRESRRTNMVAEQRTNTDAGAINAKQEIEPTSYLTKFVKDMEAELGYRAAEKGLSKGKTTRYDNPTMDFVEKNFPGHAMGTVVYKAIEFQNHVEGQHSQLKQLVKIAAWAALKYQQVSKRIDDMRGSLGELTPVMPKKIQEGYVDNLNYGKYGPDNAGSDK